MGEVINITDQMRAEDNADTQPITENIDLGEMDGQDVMSMLQTITTGDLDSISDEDKEKLGISDEDIDKIKLQMQQYQEQNKAKQAYAILGQVFSIIQEKYPDEDILPSEENGLSIYEELNEYLMKTVTEIMDTRMDEIYDEMAEKVKEIFIKEKTDPYCKYEDRLESRFEKSNLNIYAIDIPNTTFRNMSEQIKAPLQGRTIDDNFVSYRLLEFVITSVVMETAMLDDQTRKDVLTQMSNTKALLDSIAIGKISNWVVDDVVKGMDENLKDYAITVLDNIFPVIS